jgi:hypothetical protein
MRVEEMSSHDDAWTGISIDRRSSGGGSSTSSTLQRTRRRLYTICSCHKQHLPFPQLNIHPSSSLGPPAIAPLIPSHLEPSSPKEANPRDDNGLRPRSAMEECAPAHLPTMLQLY